MSKKGEKMRTVRKNSEAAGRNPRVGAGGRGAAGVKIVIWRKMDAYGVSEAVIGTDRRGKISAIVLDRSQGQEN